MGVLNVTPDSFSDGGVYLDTESAVERGQAMANEGADILDIGGVSTRPGAEAVAPEVECERILPVVQALAEHTETPLSVDSTTYDTARRCLDLGASVLNDVSCLRAEPRLADLAAQTGAGLVLMHSRGTPQTMRSLAVYDDLLGEVQQELQDAVDESLRRGVRQEQLMLDPGIGFAKNPEQSLELLRLLPRLYEMGYPLLVGTSRKSFIGHVTGREVDDRMAGTAASVAACIWGGAAVVRVHDVREMRDVARVTDAIVSAAPV